MPADAIAYYLPQYHPIDVNDQHWGPGFTEWNNVVRAKPLFPGHHQPHLPADLGFYDLRVPEVRKQQKDLALAAGISAFAVYHYWFNGRRLMERPVDDFFEDPVHEVKHLLCWANESWTLEWKGQDNVTTLEQTYSDEDDTRHAEFLVQRYLLSDRYYRHEGRPVFLVYRPEALPPGARMVQRLRDVARAHGLDPLLGGCVAFEETVDIREVGFDFSVRWAPNWLDIQRAHDRKLEKILRVESRLLAKRWPRFRSNTAYDYGSVMREHLRADKKRWPTCESAFPTWDNTARRAHGDALVVTGSTPALFEEWLRTLTARLRDHDPSLVFVNAWNEWAEGCHLEPDSRLGHTWLDVTRSVFGG